VEENAAGRGDAELLEDLRVEEWQEGHLLECVDVVIQSPDLVERDVGVHAERVCVSQRGIADLSKA
jgi:hypothetical protein